MGSVGVLVFFVKHFEASFRIGVFSASPLGHDRARKHEHGGSEELHDKSKDEEHQPVSCDRVHLRKGCILRRVRAQEVRSRPCSHNAVCDSNTEERERKADTPEELGREHHQTDNIVEKCGTTTHITAVASQMPSIGKGSKV